jgi:hypothetical protein
MVRRSVHFEVLCSAKYRYHYSEKFLHRKIKFYLRTRNPPSAYKQLSSNSSLTGKNRRAQDICLYQGCQLRGFSPKKANFGILLKNVQGIFYTNIWLLKCKRLLKLGWQHCFHRTGTFYEAANHILLTF